MTKHWLKTVSAAGLALSLFAAPAVAQDAFGDWDANDDAGIDNEEFATGFGDAGIYDEWDADDDGALSENEFNEGVYGAYDDDDDNVIEEPEFGDLNDDIGDGGFWDV
jgi:hypothetical protein